MKILFNNYEEEAGEALFCVGIAILFISLQIIFG